ncbi:50S ribosomal protein L30 [Thermoproteota archaeon]
MTKSFLIVNMRGMVNTSTTVRDTLKSLNLETRFRATIVPETPSYKGMLKKAKDQVAWCEASSSIIKQLLEKRGRMEGWTPLQKEDIQKLGFESLDHLANDMYESKAILQKMKGVKPSFALSPPKGGFKRSIRRNYNQGGILGANPDLPKIVETML